MRRQLVVIHGGTTFDSYEEYISYLRTCEVELKKIRPKKSWKSTLSEELGNTFDVLLPRMPNGTNARYEEWKIWFDRFVPLFDDEVILVGHSLGGIFLAKYLSENTFPKRITATILIAAPFSASKEESLGDFVLPESLREFAKQGGEIHLLHSTDDPVVPFSECEKYAEVLPNASKHIFESKAHFNQESFPEFVDLLKAFPV